MANSNLKQVFESFFPVGARYKGVPVVITTIAATLSLIEKFTDVLPEKFLNVNSFDILIYFSHLLMAITFIMAKMDYNLNVKKLRGKYPEIHKDFAFVKNKTQFRTFSIKALSLLNSFSKYWVCLCWVWIIYYFFKFTVLFTYAPEVPLSYNNKLYLSIIDCVSMVLNQTSSICVFLLYTIITYPKTQTQGNTFLHKVPKGLNILIFVILGYAALYIIFRIDNFDLSNTWLPILFNFLTGLISCVIFSLFVGRLDNKLLRIKPYAIAALFIYSAIQLIYPVLESMATNSQHNSIKDILVNINAFVYVYALFAKSLLFYVLLWGQKNHRLYIFMVNLLSLVNNNVEIRQKLYEKLDGI